ncbi:MAG TPA: hypothetical protein VMT30_05550 [Candidatus Saccharimonadia bacterium]|nr:hypothetical protein [Candidatus Saccharimonadia bacterium]
MTIANKTLVASGMVAALAIVILAANISYMYDLLGRCVSSKNDCQPYAYWDLINLGALILLGAAPLMLILGLVLRIRANRRAKPAE